VITPESLVSLLAQAKTRLVVVGASASLVLGAQLFPVTNVVAVRDMVSAKAMASWIETFYKALMKLSLREAFKLATDVSQAPMRLVLQQQPVPPQSDAAPAFISTPSKRAGVERLAASA
jgi:hypothetical protein